MIVTHASAIAPDPAPGPAAAAPAGPLLDAVRRALNEPPGRVALRVVATGPDEAGLAPHRCRVLKVLLQDAAQSGGGQVFETAAGELLLLGAAAGAAARAGDALAALAGSLPARAESWRLPEDGEALLRWAGGARLLPPLPARVPAGNDLAGLDALVQALPPERVLRRRGLLTLRRGLPPALAGQALEFSRGLLAAELGPLAGDADLLAHAADSLAARLPGLLGGFGLAEGGRLLLPLPREANPGPAPRPGLLAVLNLAAAADPALLAERRAMLAAAGWGLALDGLDAAALALLEPALLPADLLLLRWEPALVQAGAGLLAGPDPARLVLTGCDVPDALSWGATQGITCFAGAHVEALLAAMRLARCPAAAECGQRACGERAAATAAAGRTGCRHPGLLAGLMPALPAP